jgi:uncharacterized protein
MTIERTYTAFAGDKLVFSGALPAMLMCVKERLDAGEERTVLVFEDETGTQLDFDFSGTPGEVLARIPSHPWFATGEAHAKLARLRVAQALHQMGHPGAPAPKDSPGPGRPRLGVVSREVSLLPRHWEWLEKEPGGISGALRRLVEEARKRAPDEQRQRLVREATSKFMWVMAGNLPGFEEASRALFAGDNERLRDLSSAWPEDIRQHLVHLLRDAAP